MEPRAQRIFIRPGMAVDVTAETLLHEVLHAITDATGLAQELSDEREEQIVRAMAPMLLDTLRRNPRLISYLTAADG